MHIAVIVPAFNVAPWIGDALASVRAQTHRDWSLVLVDDGSVDATVDAATGFADPRIRLLRQVNAGVAVARNRGLTASASDAILFLDADDWLAPEALARLAGALGQAPTAVAAAARFAFVSEGAAPDPGFQPGSGSRWSGLSGTRAPASGDILPRLLERNLFANGGHLLIRRAALERAGGFRPGLAYGEDWELWCRLALLGRFAAAPGSTPALFVRQRAGGATLRMASVADSFRPCMDAIFGNPDLRARFGVKRLATLRRRAEAENAWIIGRELVRHGREPEGRAWLLRSALAKPSLRRAGLLAAAHGLAALPPAARGPFRAYPAG